MIWDKLVYRKYRDDRKVPLEMGIRVSVDDMYSYHRQMQGKFQYVYVDISKLNALEQKQFFVRFAKTYKLIIESPYFHNIFDRKDQTFARSIYYAKMLLTLSDAGIWGYAANLDRHFNTPKEVAYNTLENVYLYRVLPMYKRIGLNLVLKNSHMGPLTPDTFSISAGLKLERQNKGLSLMLDTLSAHLMGAKFVDAPDKMALSSLSKNYKAVELSGIGKAGTRTSIRTCEKYKPGAYIEFIKTFKNSIVVLSTDHIETSLSDWDYIEKYLGYKKK